MFLLVFGLFMLAAGMFTIKNRKTELGTDYIAAFPLRGKSAMIFGGGVVFLGIVMIIAAIAFNFSDMAIGNVLSWDFLGTEPLPE